MSKRLLVVTDAFLTRGQGVLVEPKITLDHDAPQTFDVRLRFPDGTERVTQASFEVAHIRGPRAPFAMVRLLELSPSDVPAGTEVWTVE